ncbi:hypothetical protein EMIHUDRAFT_469957 [Emiliania huxleyi CCMP1516]|uniref:Uncharacterized protein n=2 Tax=Emiliania huxleyi TaxID=2903 RepID=A0A0D3JA24_EMIH1|nr:hypothetical protein EMIHUDRAFT_469957 [Emiliania huxleyi CCMP1516]EOD20359.1 hypothetical protein EMIHUDRAFT_469957 [Emiliania huxleyi CCMP1516]|eukprot:XP_005772788.1 hypothetical protein EMIHUDRAFT_469957 [Emiliania huxleyi CCMP1516]
MTTESELGRHTVDCGAREDNGDTWVFAEANESVDSFTGAFPPRSCGKEWIAARHDGRSALAGGGSAEDEAEEKGGGNRAEAEEEKGGSKAEAEAKKAWQAVGSKSLSTLTATLKAHNFGRGKWLIQAEAEEVDEMWRKIVAALWEGKLGSSAKVSGAGMQMAHGGHIICVYVSPFWDTSERPCASPCPRRPALLPGPRRSAPARLPASVLGTLRTECGVAHPLKFKADGMGLLGVPKSNEWGIPPAVYVAPAGSMDVTRPAVRGDKSGVYKPKLGNRETNGEGRWRRPDGAAPPPPRSAPPPKPEEKPAAKKAADGFAALMGLAGEDSAEILREKNRRKEERAEKKRAAAAKAAEESRAAFEAVKAGVGQRNWADDESDEEEAPPAPSLTDSDASESEAESESEESESEDAVAAAAAAAAREAEAAAAAAAKERPKKKKTAEEESVEALRPREALLLELEAAPEQSAAEPAAAGQSKAAAKRAAKKAAAAAANGGAGAATGEAEAAPAAEEEGAGGEAKGVDVAAVLKARAAAAAGKKKKAGAAGGAAAIAAAELKARDAGKKKKEKRTYEKGAKQVGAKARGSDNKYQGE